MDVNDILKSLPEDGFLKTNDARNNSLSSSDKAVLIRRANEFYNQGEIEKARKIFVTVGNTDGLSRVGDYYYSQGQPFEAFKMYKLAPAPSKMEKIIEEMAGVISQLIEVDQ